MARTIRTSLLVLLVSVAACAEKDDPAARASGKPPKPSTTVAPSATTHGGALARDGAHDVPTLWAATPAAPNAHRYLERGIAPEAAAREQLGTVLSVYRATDDALDAARVVRVHDTGTGPIAVVLRQSVGGIDVLHRDVKVLLRRDLEMVAIGGSLRADARRSAPAPAFSMTPEQAVASALAHVHGVKIDAAALHSRKTDDGGYARFELDRAAAPIELVRPARARKVLYAGGDVLAPAYHVEVASRAGHGGEPVTRALVVDATDGSVRQESELTHHETFDYRVWARPDGSPVMPIADVAPHPTGEPDGFYPAFVSPSLIAQEGFNANPDGEADPWLPADATETRGNNVDAYTDGGGDGFDDDDGDVRAALTGERTFDRTFDTSLDPLASDTQRMASVTQLFYTTNWLHDAWYDVGFDEEAGNAQDSNFGRGGAQGDRMQAQAQDNAPNDLNNANMYVPADGESPVMQMYLFDGRNGAPYADSGLDVDVVAHEWGHYLHLRLVDCEFGICWAESEGWGDFLSLHTAVREGDDLEATYGMGSYASGAGENAAYFGIRQFPYTRDLDRNGLTFKNIQDSEGPPDGPDNLNGYPPSEPHNSGEVWTSMLWQAYTNLLVEATGPNARYDFDEARRRMAEYVVTGMTLAPANPTFTEQRDAILLAAEAVDAEDSLLLAQGFATRGAGTCAISPDREQFDNEGVVESFVVGSEAEVTSAQLVVDESCDDDAYLDRGEQGHVQVTVRNGGWIAMSGATVTIGDAGGVLAFPSGATVDLPEIERQGEATVSVPVTIADAVEGLAPIDVVVTVDDPGGCAEQTEATFPVATNADEGLGFFDPVENSATSWTTDASEQWSRGPGIDGGTAWHGLDLEFPSESSLVSPPIQVATNLPFILSFRHRYGFEDFYDGGVVEVSTDDGSTWRDLTQLGGDLPYTGTAEALGSRPAFNTYNPSYPDSDDVTANLGIALAGDTIRLRFRIATDASAGFDGWFVDDIRVSGAVEPPFIGLVDDATECGEGSGGGGGGGQGGDGAQGPGQTSGPSTSGVGTTGQGPIAASSGAGSTSEGAGGDDGGEDPDDGCDCRAAPGSDGSRGAGAGALAMLALAAFVRRKKH